jgi:hypothetical protein
MASGLHGIDDMKITPLLGALALVAGCASASETADTGATAAGCDITVAFGSYAMGIDGQAAEAVEAYVSGHPALVTASQWTRWGREGEKTACLTTASPQATRTVFKALRALLPDVARRGPVRLESRLGQRFQSKSPLKH